MTPLQRSRRLQAGLAGLGILSTLGAAVGLDLATSTHSSATSGSGSASTGTGTQQSGQSGRSHRSGGSGESDDGGRAATRQNLGQQSSPVTPPSNSTPQATTSGS